MRLSLATQTQLIWGPDHQALSIAQKTTVEVKSTNIRDLEKGITRNNRQRIVLGSMTVCSAGDKDEDEAANDEARASHD